MEIRSTLLSLLFFFSSRRRHTRCSRDWSSDVCSSDLTRKSLSRTSNGYETNRPVNRAADPSLHVRRSRTGADCSAPAHHRRRLAWRYHDHVRREQPDHRRATAVPLDGRRPRAGRRRHRRVRSGASGRSVEPVRRRPSSCLIEWRGVPPVASVSVSVRLQPHGRRGREQDQGCRPRDTAHRPELPLQVGQFKAPFGLQQVNSSGRLQFVDRAITDAKYNPGREMGVMFAGAAVARKLGYEVGVFNGSGESIRQNNRSQLWAGRIFVDPLGAYTLAEGSSDATERPVVHVGVGAHGGKAIRGRTTAGVVDEADNQLAYNVEFAFKSPRFDATAEHFWMTDEQQNPVS